MYLIDGWMINRWVIRWTITGSTATKASAVDRKPKTCSVYTVLQRFGALS